MALQLFSRKSEGKRSKSAHRSGMNRQSFVPAEATTLDSDSLNRCVQLGRFGHILANAEEWKDHPKIGEVCRLARETLDEQFAIVPEGFASLPQTINDYPGSAEITVETDPFLLARHTVTNAQYQQFVDAGAYEQLDLWPKDIWPHLIDFKDQTGCSGPRYWREGRHSKPQAQHPVVGICYYEAAAFVQWAGLRLPTEAEWQMACTWRIRSVAHVLRRYPWGDSLDTDRCNIWASRIGTTVPVHEYPDGAAPNHVLQLVGNVWEWTACDFNVTDNEGGMIVGDMQLSAVRGGSFDTYFPAQATGSFRTGMVSLARVHNTGFRCALDLSVMDAH